MSDPREGLRPRVAVVRPSLTEPMLREHGVVLPEDRLDPRLAALVPVARDARLLATDEATWRALVASGASGWQVGGYHGIDGWTLVDRAGQTVRVHPDEYVAVGDELTRVGMGDRLLGAATGGVLDEASARAPGRASVGRRARPCDRPLVLTSRTGCSPRSSCSSSPSSSTGS